MRPTSPPGQTWNTDRYAIHGRFVATLASAVVSLLDPRPGEHILDLGCGDGALTAELINSGALILGVDASPTMVAAARARGLAVDQYPAQLLPYRSQFDAVFSNAALHWIPVIEQPIALTRIHAALKPGGRFVAEMGGHANIAAIRTALSAVLPRFGIDPEVAAASFFPTAAQYQTLLEAARFEVVSVDLVPRPTPLPGGPDGMATWLNTFRNGVLDRLSPSDRVDAVASTIDLLRPILSDPTGNWTADYVRLRFQAVRK